MLQSELEEVEVLCLTEHWLKEEYIKLISIDEFKLVSNFSRSESIHGGTCIYVKHYLKTREVNYLNGIGKEKDFEISAVEVLDYKLIVVCVYRSPDGDFSIFLRNLESVIQKVKVRKRWLILCGDWNINFVKESSNLSDVQELLTLYNLVNTVRTPTRVTKNSASLIDVVITDKEIISDVATVIDLGFSDHKAQVLQITVNRRLKKFKVITSRQYTEKRVEEFKYMLSKESWQEVYQTLEVNSALQIFRENFGYYFNIAFPYKSKKLRNAQNKDWITKGLKNSGKKMRFLNVIKRKFNLSREAQAYIKRYQTIYRTVLKEAKKRENDKLIEKAANKTKKVWQLINKQVGKCSITNKKIELMTAAGIETNPQTVAELLNEHFIETVNELIIQNKCIPHTQVKQSSKIEYCPDSMVMLPITEQEVECVIRKLKGKFSAGCDEIPEYVVKQCAMFIKGPLTYIYNMSVNSGVFPDLFKVARVKPLYKKGDTYNIQNYRPISILSVFSKILEKIMYSRLTGFLNKHNIITKVQNGFREQKSTITAIQSFIEKIREALDDGLKAVGIFFLFNQGL
jgi:hypothetical protein